MNTKQLLRLALCVATLGLGLFVASPAQAATSDGVCPTLAKERVVDIEYFVDGTSVTDLLHNVHSGATVLVKFNIDPDCGATVVSLASYTSTSAVFTPQNAADQVLFDSTTGSFTPKVDGKYTQSVDIPECFFQVDFVQGAVITKFGPPGSTNFYQYGQPVSRLISHDDGGTTECETVETTTTTTSTTVASTTTSPTVLGTVVTKPPTKPTVLGSVLARTGVNQSTMPLAMLGVMLLMLGFGARQLILAHEEAFGSKR